MAVLKERLSDLVRSGRKLILAGSENEQKKSYRTMLEQANGELCISEQLEEAAREDYVLLFASAEEMNGLLELFHDLQLLAELKPASVVLISDSCVFGRVFGTDRALSEHEIGYASHIMAEDIPVTNLRTAENVAFRLAKEEQLNIKIVRKARTCCQMDELSDIINVLQNGKAGEVFNLSSHQGYTGKWENSPLTPVVVHSDASKMEDLRA